MSYTLARFEMPSIKRQSVLDTIVSIVAFATCVVMLALASTLSDPLTMVAVMIIGVMVGSAAILTLTSLIKRKMNENTEVQRTETRTTPVERHSDPTDVPPTYEECVRSPCNHVTVNITMETVASSPSSPSLGENSENRPRVDHDGPAVLEVVSIQDTSRRNSGWVNDGFDNDEEPPPSYIEALRLKALLIQQLQQVNTITS